MVCALASSAGIILGAAALLWGLFTALAAARAESAAIKSVAVHEDIVGRVVETGWWQRQFHLEQSSKAFRRGLLLTAAGIVLQAIGGVLGNFCSLK